MVSLWLVPMKSSKLITVRVKVPTKGILLTVNAWFCKLTLTETGAPAVEVSMVLLLAEASAMILSTSTRVSVPKPPPFWMIPVGRRVIDWPKEL